MPTQGRQDQGIGAPVLRRLRSRRRPCQRTRVVASPNPCLQTTTAIKPSEGNILRAQTALANVLAFSTSSLKFPLRAFLTFPLVRPPESDLVCPCDQRQPHRGGDLGRS